MNFKSVFVDNVDLIERLLLELNFAHVKYNKDGFRFGFDDYSNPTAMVLNPSNLKFIDFRNNKSGDILDLICYKLEISISSGLSWLTKFLGVGVSFDSNEDPFRRLIKEIKDDIEDSIELTEYDDSELNPYPKIFSKLFEDDGIGLLPQIIFDIRYNDEEERVLIPIRNEEGKLVGAIGRLNQRNVPKGVAKYLPTIRYPKARVLYGMWENRDFLNDTMIIVESEKSVIKAAQYGYRNVVALGGNRLSDHHLSLIKRLNPKRVILMLDKGLRNEHILTQRDRLFSKNPFTRINVGYIDSNNIGILPDKANCFDLDKEDCKKVLDMVKWCGYRKGD